MLFQIKKEDTADGDQDHHVVVSDHLPTSNQKHSDWKERRESEDEPRRKRKVAKT